MKLIRRDDPAPLDRRGDAVDALGKPGRLSMHRGPFYRHPAYPPHRAARLRPLPRPDRSSRRRARRACADRVSLRGGGAGARGTPGQPLRGRPPGAGRSRRPPADRSPGREGPPPATRVSRCARGTRALLGSLADADVVVATTTGTTVALGTWRALGRLKRPLVGIVAGLVTDEWRSLRRRTTRRRPALVPQRAVRARRAR